MSREPAPRVRIGATLLFVLLLDLLFAFCLASLVRPWVLPLVEPLPAVVGWLLLAAPVTALLVLAQFRYTRREVLAEASARRVPESERPDLYARVRRLATGADVPVPTLAVAESDVPNAFTVGTPRNATLVVSTGLLDALSSDELDAVLAHELAHVKNRDATVMTLATFLPALAGEYSLFRELGWDRSTRYASWGVTLAVLYVLGSSVIDAPPFGLRYTLSFGMLVAFVALFGGVLLGLVATPVVLLAGGLSHDREFVADRAGATLTGNPAAMVAALRTLADERGTPTEDARSSGRVGRLCFVPGGFGGGDVPFETLPLDVRSHPPTEERVERLRDLVGRQ